MCTCGWLETASDFPHNLQMQAAARIAEAASGHANDDDFESPYSKQALRQGFDLPWWTKLLGTRLVDGRLQLARLKVCVL